MAFRIVDWANRYEPGSEKQPDEPKPKTRRCVGPLKYAMLAVHGHSLSPGYRRLKQVGGVDALAAFGLFARLLELAADEPRDNADMTTRRDGTIYYQDHPATIQEIAFLIDWPEPETARLMSHLVAVNWVADTCAQLRAAADGCPQVRAGAKNCAPNLTVDLDIDKDVNKDILPANFVAGTPEPEPPKEKTPRKRDEIWDTVCEVFGWTEVPKSQRTSVGQVVRDLKELGATPDEIRVRTARMRAAWDGKPFSPQAVVKWWTQYATEPSAGGGQRPVNAATGRGVRERASARGEYPEPERPLPHL